MQQNTSTFSKNKKNNNKFTFIFCYFTKLTVDPKTLKSSKNYKKLKSFKILKNFMKFKNITKSKIFKNSWTSRKIFKITIIDWKWDPKATPLLVTK